MTLHDFCRENGREELLAQWDDAKNRPLTPSDVTSGSHRFVWWRCENGHAWRSAVSTRAGKQRCGCPYCSGRTVLVGFNDLASKESVLALQWHPTRNGGLTPQQLTPGSSRKVWWQCENGHAWRADVSTRTGKRRCGCPVCAGRPMDRCTAVISEAPAEPEKISAQTAGSRGVNI